MLRKVWPPPYFYDFNANPKGFACNLQAENLNHEIFAHFDFYFNIIPRKTVEHQFKMNIFYFMPCRGSICRMHGIKGYNASLGYKIFTNF